MSQIEAYHILKKHAHSRRPSSWRESVITQSKEDAINQIIGIRDILSAKASGGIEELRSAFSEIAQIESDCSSAKSGGCLGFFGKGQMQKSFEDAAFALNVGEMSEVVDSDSGIHIILRTA